jgi:two-component system response regulator YcbB
LADTSINEISIYLNTNPKSMDQRIRRAISKGLSNIAHLGIEDYMNEIFIMYSSSLFNFEEVKNEMDYIRGNKNYPGKINIRKFIDGLIINIHL